jgi:RHS repeat-associated protein
LQANRADLGRQTPTYDAAGNLTADGTGTHTYQWDAEGRLSGNTYDALGQLVQNGATAFPYDAFGNQAAWYTFSNGVWFVMFVPFQGQILADAANDVFFHRNALGSVGYTTQANGSYYEEYLYYPWGQIWANPVGRQYEQRFASMPFLDEATQPIFGTPFRTYPPRLGRWLSPDPLAGDVENPQSMNRYAYALNSPCSMVDPLGLDSCNFNVAINNQTGGSLGTNAIEGTIEQIFQKSSQGANTSNSVGVSFVAGGQTDFTLTFNNNGVPGGPSGNAVLGGNSGQVFANLYPPSVYLGYTNEILGVLGAHEIGHGLGNVGDLPFKQYGAILMSIDTNPAWMLQSTQNPLYSPDFPAGLLFTPTQVGQLWNRCHKSHPNGNPRPGGGGSGGSAGIVGDDPTRGQNQVSGVVCWSGEPGGCDVTYTWMPIYHQQK